MRAVDFLATFGPRGAAAWEAAAIDLARRHEIVVWPLVPVTLTDGAHTLLVNVASDYFAVGEPEAPLRLPLTPLAAQRVADAFGMLLPTTKLVKAIHEQAPAKLTTGGLVPNRNANLAQYADHNALVSSELASRSVIPGTLTSGSKKDVVIGNLLKKGKVLIYGWLKPLVPPGRDPQPMMTAPWRVQPYSSVHGDTYVDYSHGIRLVSPKAFLDGQPVDLASVLRDPKLSSLVSDEGPLRTVRYDVPFVGPDSPNSAAVAINLPPPATRERFVDRGLALVQSRVEETAKERIQ
jgi:hypothetical protein